MFPFSVTLFSIIDIVFQVMYILIIARVILSFIKHNPYNPIIRFIYEVTEPILKPFRKISMPVGAGVSIDFSPILAYFVLRLLHEAVLWIARLILF